MPSLSLDSDASSTTALSSTLTPTSRVTLPPALAMGASLAAASVANVRKYNQTSTITIRHNNSYRYLIGLFA